MEAGHPVPDENSLRAGEEMLQLAASIKEGDLVIFLLSGGASALMESPVEGIQLEDLQAINSALLASGATIMTMNAIRSCTSRIKAGGLAKAFGKGEVVVLCLSDVDGDRLNVIGSGPFVATQTFPDLTKIIGAYDLHFPPRVLKVLSESPYAKEAPERPPHLIVGNLETLYSAARDAANAAGLPGRMFAPMDGEAREFAALVRRRTPIFKGREDTRDCLISAGETVVRKTGNGLGGRAQEMACVFAEKIAKLEGIAFLVAGSDGTDGPTDAAGALVDGETIARAKANGFTVKKTLAENDSYHFHEAAGTLIKTGPTGTNLNDLMIMVRA
jgi:glycerate 2-kinase